MRWKNDERRIKYLDRELSHTKEEMRVFRDEQKRSPSSLILNLIGLEPSSKLSTMSVNISCWTNETQKFGSYLLSETKDLKNK